MKEDMRGLFFVVKGQYKKDNNVVCISGYDPSDENTKEWYQVMDCKTFHSIACGTNFNKVLHSVYTYIKKYKGNAKLYFKHVCKVTSEDYYEVNYLGKRPLTSEQISKKVVGRCPRVSPTMKTLYGAVYKAYGDTYEEEIKDMEDLAYNDLKGDRPLRKTQKLVKKHSDKKMLMETPKTSMEEIVTTPKRLVKPKVKMGVKKLKLQG